MVTKPSTAIQVAAVPALDARRGPGVQVAGVDHPGDERPDLLRVPAPVPAPGRLGPDRARRSRANVPDRERERVQAEGRAAPAPAAPAAARPACTGTAAVACALRSYPVRIRNSAAGTKPSRKMPEARTIAEVTWIDEPVRVQRRHQRADRRVQPISPPTPSSTTSGERHEQAERAGPPGRRDQRAPARPADADEASRDSMNSYMLPQGIRLGGDAAGDQGAEVRERRRAG